ncbi:MAG: hypothetical protein Q9219_005935 [cf. Caloplaca sp. 3 TL-2023]
MADLLAQLRSVKDSTQGADLDNASRLEATKLARTILLDLENPSDLVHRLLLQPAENVWLRIAVDTGLLEALNEAQLPQTAQDLAKATDVDLILLERVLRGLVVMRAVEEIDEDNIDTLYPIWNKLPEFLASTGYRNPTDPENGAIQLAHPADKSFFDHLARNPAAVKNFGAFMAAFTVGRPNFLDFYPAAEQLVQGSKSDPQEVMLVDVGGATGDQALEFRRRLPTAPGRLIVQDRADVIEPLPEVPGLEKMVHDFFNPQPVHGARAYYFRHVFHNWSDAPSLEILRKTTAAMVPGYSKILINEFVVPRRNPNSLATSMDLSMMSILSAIERTDQQWRELLSAAGLKIVNIWSPEGGTESIIEAMLDEKN